MEEKSISAYKHTPRGLAVPDGRLSRLARLGGVAAGVAGNVALSGAGQMLNGARPRMSDLLLTPANAARITRQLAQMRGAAMKMGQLLSMEGGDFLPRELADILGHLRNDAHFMPPAQLKRVLSAQWGADFMQRFRRFDVRPLAAASIGQVHRAHTRDGRDLAIKVQYPGVRQSIDSDVRNVAALLRLSGLVPAEIDLAPLLDEARRQLHEEADYAREGQMLARFGALLADDDAFAVPAFHADLSTRDTLAMDFMPGIPVDRLAAAPQPLRDRVMTDLIRLSLRELFGFQLMQSDPNFANYHYDETSERVVLLDFGATRAFDPQMVASFRALLDAGLADDADALRAAMIRIGYFHADSAARHQEAILGMTRMAMEPLRRGGQFDFAQSDLADRMRAAGMEFAKARDFWVIPPMDTLYLQRKMGGLYLLGSRLSARVDLDRAMASAGIQGE
ncbi:MAG: AarF/ABC1/UbiB kinase family protein [Rhodobacteraceae bacterium]|nr:AarF/ABC1/UbiB kinase family protein [Paracoccaceae bacterium]